MARISFPAAIPTGFRFRGIYVPGTAGEQSSDRMCGSRPSEPHNETTHYCKSNPEHCRAEDQITPDVPAHQRVAGCERRPQSQAIELIRPEASQRATVSEDKTDERQANEAVQADQRHGLLRSGCLVLAEQRTYDKRRH